MVLWRPTLKPVRRKIQETGRVVYCPYPRRLEQLTICRCHGKGSTLSSVILRPWVWVWSGLEPSNSRTTARTQPPMLIKRRRLRKKVFEKNNHATFNTPQYNTLINVNVSLLHNHSVHVLYFSVWVLFVWINIILFLPYLQDISSAVTEQSVNDTSRFHWLLITLIMFFFLATILVTMFIHVDLPIYYSWHPTLLLQVYFEGSWSLLSL